MGGLGGTSEDPDPWAFYPWGPENSGLFAVTGEGEVKRQSSGVGSGGASVAGPLGFCSSLPRFPQRSTLGGGCCARTEVRTSGSLPNRVRPGSPAWRRQKGSSQSPLPSKACPGPGGAAVQGGIVPKQGPRRSGLCVKHVRFGAERLEKEFSTRMGRKRGSGSLLRWTKF